ncbi:MAG: WG repeat-containing protein [Cyclobacteriaceae bacterium]|nr:WG repeat-containing protein [Cyclobacteriaceae bacterium]
MKGLFVIVLFLIGFSCRADSFLVFEENGKVGIKDQDGKVVLPASFDALGWADGSFSVIGDVTGYRLNNQWGMINLKKEFITKAEFESIVYSSGEYLVARKKINPAQVKAGCLNLRGETKIPFQYDGIQVHGLRAIVFHLQKGRYYYGLTDLENRIVIPVLYKQIYPLGTLRYAVEDEHGKIALFTETGKAISAFNIDSIAAFRNSKAIMYQNLNQGLLDREGNIVVEPVYQEIDVDTEEVKVLPHDEWLIITPTNKLKQKFSAESIVPIERGYIYRYGTQFGLLDTALNVLVPAQYDQLVPLKVDLFLASRNGKQGIIQADNVVVFPFQYDSLQTSNELIRAYQKPKGWILTNLNQSFKTEKQYDFIGESKEAYWPVRNFGFWGLLNSAGIETVHCVFDSLLEISEDRIVVKFRNQYGIISTREEWLVAPQPYPLQLLNDSCYLQKQAPLTFLKKYSGETIYFTENPIVFKEAYWNEYVPDGTIKTLDYNGSVLARTPAPVLDRLEEIYAGHEGMRGIKRDGKYGFIDDRNRLRIANRYDDIGYFQEGLAAVKLIGKWGFINAEDQIVIHPNYEAASPFVQGLSLVRRGGKAGIIDRNGKYILSLHYDSMERLPNNKIKLYKDGLVGLADAQGTLLIETRFSQLEELNNGLIMVVQGSRHGVISGTGLPVIPVIYDSITYDPIQNQFLASIKSVWKEIVLN